MGIGRSNSSAQGQRMSMKKDSDTKSMKRLGSRTGQWSLQGRLFQLSSGLVLAFAISADNTRGKREKKKKKKKTRTCHTELQYYIFISVKLSMGKKKQ